MIIKVLHHLILIICIAILAGCQPQDSKSFRHGQEALNKGQFDEAIKAFTQVVKNFPESQHHEQSLFQLGEIYFRYAKDPEKAIDYYSQLIFSHPDSHNTCLARINIADMYLNRYEEFEKAVEEYQKAIVHCSDSERKEYALLKIGDCYYEAGNYKQAIIEYRTFEKEYTQSQYYITAIRKIADCHFINGDMMNAEIYYRKILNRETNDEQKESVKLSLAHVLMNVNQPCLALELYVEILESNPDREDILRLKAKADEDCLEKSSP